MSAVLNISSYLFVTLRDTAELRERLHAEALARGLKGTVLIAEEGINLFLAGPPEAVRGWVAVLRADPRFAQLAPKESWSDTVPFKKLLVKVKGEIIRMNHPTIRPDAVGDAGRAPAVEPAVLRQWLAQGHDDAGRPVVTLDTRNDFEVDYGTFEGAIDWRIAKFSEFPEAVQAHKAAFEGKTVVSVLHEVSMALQADHVAVLARGRIVHHGAAADPDTHRAVERVFDHRIAIHSVAGQWMALPRLHPTAAPPFPDLNENPSHAN